MLSFAVRELKCQAGIMVTASHNPAAYNGYKCYGADGCQMTDIAAGEVYAEIQATDCFDGVKTADFEQAAAEGSIEYMEDGLYEKYLENVSAQAINPGICKDAGLKVVYTPLNGAGNKLVREILKRTGVSEVTVVKEQETRTATLQPALIQTLNSRKRCSWGLTSVKRFSRICCLRPTRTATGLA